MWLQNTLQSMLNQQLSQALPIYLIVNLIIQAMHSPPTPTFHIVLYQPEIPPNTGNIIRLCANTGAQLHLIKPLGFSLEDKQLRRAGLDYHEYAQVQVHENLDTALQVISATRLFALSSHATTRYDSVNYQQGDAFLFGPETRGLPADILQQLPTQQRLRLPMQKHNRSLNLSNTVAVMAFEAWRQLDFIGGS